jgi:phosphate transport system substrate-binding protein
VTHKNIGLLASVAALAMGLAACGSSKSSTSTTGGGSGATISGAGSTFAAPVYQQWASQQSGLTVNYQAVGSGAGLTALGSKTVDFGASDPPLKPADEEAIAKNGSPAVQVPMFLGAITVSYNLPGVAAGMKLEGKTISEIFLGKIKTWNASHQDLERLADQSAEPGRIASEHLDHGHPPLGLLGHDRGLHRLPGRHRPRIQEQGR